MTSEAAATLFPTWSMKSCLRVFLPSPSLGTVARRAPEGQCEAGKAAKGGQG